MPIKWQNVKRLLVWLGEDVEIQPALRLLRNALPNASIVLLTTSGINIKGLLPFVNETLEQPSGWQQATPEKTLIGTLQTNQFHAAIIFTNQNSPYPFAYLCYLAGIPIRLGLSQEFGGGVLSECIQPPENPQNRYLYLLKSAYLPIP